MRYEELNWFDVDAYLKQDDRLMLVTGACEQHAYLSLLTDVKIPLAIADAASKISGVLIGPPVNFGVSPYFLDYPGTLSLRASTMMDMTEDLVRSACHQGFRRILILNGHGGNDTIRSRLYEIGNQIPDLKLAWYAWWQSHSIESLAQKYDLKPSHGSWMEAFPFTIVSNLPKTPKHPPRIHGLPNAKEAKNAYGDGSFGGPYSVDQKIMAEIMNAATQDVLHLLEFEA